MQGEGTGFQPGHFDEGLHEEVQLVDLPLHGVQEHSPLFPGKLGVPQDSRVKLDIGDGRFHLMGNVAD